MGDLRRSAADTWPAYHPRWPQRRATPVPLQPRVLPVTLFRWARRAPGSPAL